MASVYEDIDFLLDGASARAAGIIMQSEPVISALEPNIETFDIPGRNGSLHCFDGTYKDRTVTISCYAVGYDNTRDDGYFSGGNGVYAVMQRINGFLFPTGGAGYILPVRKLVIGRSDTYYKALILNGAEIAARLKTLTPFEIVFTVNPIRYNISDDSEAGL